MLYNLYTQYILNIYIKYNVDSVQLILIFIYPSACSWASKNSQLLVITEFYFSAPQHNMTLKALCGISQSTCFWLSLYPPCGPDSNHESSKVRSNTETLGFLSLWNLSLATIVTRPVFLSVSLSLCESLVGPSRLCIYMPTKVQSHPACLCLLSKWSQKLLVNWSLSGQSKAWIITFYPI